MMSCIFDLNESDIRLYSFLIGKDEMRVEEIAKNFKKDRSTIQRSLKKLMECMLVERRKKIIGRGGYYYVYRAISPGKAKNVIKVCLDEWYKKMAVAVENFEYEIHE